MNFVKDTGTIKGRGVFAGRRYRTGDVVDVSSVVVFEGEYETLPLPIHQLIYDWVGREDVETSALALGHGSLFNHANPANMRFRADYKNRQITYMAARPIKKGEELTINYNHEDGEPVSSEDSWFDDFGFKPI